MTKLPEFMVRVKLPNPNGYAACPSGDTDYEVDYHKALKAATPDGFEAIEERIEVSRPVDSTGYTYVRLRCVDEKLVVAKLSAEVRSLQRKLDKVAGAIGKCEPGLRTEWAIPVYRAAGRPP